MPATNAHTLTDVSLKIEEDHFDLLVTAKICPFSGDFVTVELTELKWWDDAADEFGPAIEAPTFAMIAADDRYDFEDAADVQDWASAALFDSLQPSEPWNLP